MQISGGLSVAAQGIAMHQSNIAKSAQSIAESNGEQSTTTRDIMNMSQEEVALQTDIKLIKTMEEMEESILSLL